jgi:hypothetical protein
LGISLATAMIVVIAVLDTLEIWVGLKLNLAILYIVPLIIYAHTHKSRRLLWLAALLILLTYAKFAFLYNTPRWMGDDHILWRARLLNRSFVAIMIALIALLLSRWRQIRSRWEIAKGPLANVQEQGTLLHETFTAMEQGSAALVAAVLALGLFVTDLTVAPGEINMPILYLVPLVVVGLTCRRSILWITAVVLIVFAIVGYHWGPAPQVENNLWGWLASNRSLACAAIALTAALLRFIRQR